MSEALEDIQAEIEQLKSVKVGDVEFSVKFFLGAYWKFLALLMVLHQIIALKCTPCRRPLLGGHVLTESAPTKALKKQLTGARLE